MRASLVVTACAAQVLWLLAPAVVAQSGTAAPKQVAQQHIQLKEMLAAQLMVQVAAAVGVPGKQDQTVMGHPVAVGVTV